VLKRLDISRSLVLYGVETLYEMGADGNPNPPTERGESLGENLPTAKLKNIAALISYGLCQITLISCYTLELLIANVKAYSTAASRHFAPYWILACTFGRLVNHLVASCVPAFRPPKAPTSRSRVYTCRPVSTNASRLKLPAHACAYACAYSAQYPVPPAVEGS